MKLRSIALAVSLSALSLSAVACGGSVEHSPQTSAGALTKAPVAQNAHGVVRVIGDALGEVGLRADQRAEIEKLAADAEARHAPMADGRKELMLAFADQVESGAVDRAALQPKIDRVNADLAKARAEDRAALQRLHDLLDAEQRNAFVDALEARFEHKRGARGARGEGGPKEGFGGGLHRGGPPGAGFAGMHRLAEELQLTDEQKTQIRDVMKEEWKARANDRGKGPKAHPFARGKGGPGGPRAGKRALEAFRADKLTLDELTPPGDGRAAGAGIDAMSGFATKVVPLLTPEQRKTAADKLRDMAARGDAVPGAR